MKKIMALVAICLVSLLAAPALAAGLGISPPSVELDVPADGSMTQVFTVYNFDGELQISLEDIPLQVEPETITVSASEGGTNIKLTFYGNESVGSQTFNGYIRFLGLIGGNVAVGIKVKAKVTHIVEVSPVPEAPPPAPPAPPGPPPATSGTTELPILPVVGIAAGAAIVITLIVVLTRRRRY